MKIVIFLLGLLLIFGMPVTALAIEVGLGASFSNKFLNVFNADGKEIAALEGDSGLWPHISIKSHDRYFGDSSFGYSFYGWYTQGGGR